MVGASGRWRDGRALAGLSCPLDLDRVGDHGRDDGQRRLVGLAERGALGALGDEHAGQLAEREHRDRDPALRLVEAGQRDLATGPDLARLLVGAAHAVAVLRHLAQVADADAEARAAAMPMMPSPTSDLGADALVGESLAGDRVEPAAVLVEQHEQAVLVAEDVGEAVDRRADDGVEVGAAAQPRDELADALRARCGAGRRSTGSRRSRTRSTSSTR